MAARKVNKAGPTARLRKLGVQIEEMCSQRGWLKQDLAERMGVSNSYISQIVARGGTPKQIEQVASALGVSPWDFDRYHVLTFEERVTDGDLLATKIAIKLIEDYRASQGPDSDS
jgi:transcriptional regulator with XRE-family HTH domain